MAVILIIVTFGAVFMLIFGINLLIAEINEAHRLKVRKRLESESHLKHQMRTKRFATRKSNQTPDDDPDDEPVRLSQWERFTRLVNESGLPVRPVQVALICAAFALCAGAIVAARFHSWPLAVLTAAAAAYMPIAYVSRARRQRVSKLLSQLPEAFDVMGRSMRAGQTISQAMQSVADDMSAPVAEEFGYCCDQQNLGLSPEAAMRGLALRTGILEMKIFVLAVMVHNQTGGNLAELLDRLSTVIRDRYKIRGSIQALTAEGRMQMMILLALPPLMLAVLMVLNRPYASILFDYPNVLFGTAESMGIGALIMASIVNFDF